MTNVVRLKKDNLYSAYEDNAVRFINHLNGLSIMLHGIEMLYPDEPVSDSTLESLELMREVVNDALRVVMSNRDMLGLADKKDDLSGVIDEIYGVVMMDVDTMLTERKHSEELTWPDHSTT